MKTIKNRIRDLREDRDLRQIDVADATGIDQKTLSNYETGKTNLDSYSIMKLADFFKVSTDYLLGYSDLNILNKKDILKRLEKIEDDIRVLRKALELQND